MNIFRLGESPPTVPLTHPLSLSLVLLIPPFQACNNRNPEELDALH